MNHITYYYVHRRICFRLYTDLTNVGRRQRREKTIFFSRPAVSVCERLCVCVLFLTNIIRYTFWWQAKRLFFTATAACA